MTGPSRPGPGAGFGEDPAVSPPASSAGTPASGPAAVGSPSPSGTSPPLPWAADSQALAERPGRLPPWQSPWTQSPRSHPQPVTDHQIPAGPPPGAGYALPGYPASTTPDPASTTPDLVAAPYADPGEDYYRPSARLDLATPPDLDLAGISPAGTSPAGTSPAGTSPAGESPAGEGSYDERGGYEPSGYGQQDGPGEQAGPDDHADTVAAEPGESPGDALDSIKKTFALVAAAGDKAAGYFYAKVFTQAPQVRSLFPPAMDEQRDRLFQALAHIVESLSTPEELARYLSQLGRDHRKYSVEPAMYEVVGSCLLATLRAYAREEFTPAAEAAWTEAYLAASSIMINAAEEDSKDSPAYWTAEVVEHELVARDVAVVTLAPDQPFPYEPGQHVTVQTTRWPNVWRSYSIACRPREDGLIRLNVKAVPGGWVSGTLVHRTRPGDEVRLGPPLGTMTLAPAEDRDLLCVAGGTGLAPLRAIAEEAIKTAASASRRRQIFMFYGARQRSDLYDLRELWRLADAYPDFDLTPVTSDDPAFSGMQGNVGRVAARYMPHTDCEAYVAGPESMVRETIRVLTRAGVSRDRMHFDDTLLARVRVGTGT